MEDLRLLDPCRASLIAWAAVLVLGALPFFGLYGLEFSSYVLIIAGVASFAAGAYAAQLDWTTAPEGPEEDGLVSTRSAVRTRTWAAVAVTSALFAAGVWFAQQYVAEAGGPGKEVFLMARMRYLAEVAGDAPRFFYYTTHLTVVALTSLFFVGVGYAKTGANRWIFAALSLVALLLSLLTTGRTAPVLVMISICVYGIAFGLVRARTVLRLAPVAILVVFFGIGALLGKSGMGDENSGAGTTEAITDHVAVYFLSGPLAFQEILRDTSTVDDPRVGSHTFFYFFELAKKFGLAEDTVRPTLDFVFVPFPTNVYTFLRPFWMDFGYAMFPLVFVLGLVTGWAYRLARSGVLFAIYVYPLFLNGVVLQVFEEQTFANLGLVVLYAVLLVALQPLLLAPAGSDSLPSSPIQEARA